MDFIDKSGMPVVEDGGILKYTCTHNCQCVEV